MDTKETLTLKAWQQENAELQDEIKALIGWGWSHRAEKEALRAENKRLKTALHDAINRPMGVVPESAEPFYDAQRQE